MTAFYFAAILMAQSIGAMQVQSGTVTGRLLAMDGVPAQGVRVAALPAQVDAATGAPALFGISQTDVNGRYRLENIPPGRYYIFAGLIDFPSYYPNATTLDKAKELIVNSGVTLSGIDFSMSRPAGLTIAGHFAMPSTIPSSNGWTVTLTPVLRNTASSAAVTRIGLDGSFEFLRLIPGEYRLSSNLRGSAPVSVLVAETDIRNIVIPVIDCNAGASVSGRLVGSALPAVQSISLTGSKVGCTPTTSVASDGSFSFKNVPEGLYQFRLSPVPPGWMATGVAVEKTDVIDLEVRLPVTVSINGHARVEDGSELEKPSLPEGLRLAGQLSFAATGAQPGPQSVVLVSTSEYRNAVLRTANVSPDGSFEFTGVPSGTYNLETYPDNPAALYGIVVDNADVTGVRFSIPTLVKVEGRIEWPNIQGLTVSPDRSRVSVQFTRKEGTRTLAWGTLSQNGSFRFYLPEGDYRFSMGDIPAGFSLGTVTFSDINILEEGLHVRSNSDPPSLRVTLRER